MITSNLQILGGSLCDSLAGYPAPFPGFLSLNKERKGTCFPREEEPEHKRKNHSIYKDSKFLLSSFADLVETGLWAFWAKYSISAQKAVLSVRKQLT